MYEFLLNFYWIFQVIKVDKVGMQYLPMEVEEAEIYREDGIGVVNSRKGFSLHCNFKYDVCTFELSGVIDFVL